VLVRPAQRCRRMSSIALCPLTSVPSVTLLDRSSSPKAPSRLDHGLYPNLFDYLFAQVPKQISEHDHLVSESLVELRQLAHDGLGSIGGGSLLWRLQSRKNAEDVEDPSCLQQWQSVVDVVLRIR